VADIRFQFLINGEPVCLAGAEGFGIFSATLTWVKRDQESYRRAKAEAPDTWNCSEEEWTRESLGMSARTCDTKYPQYGFWLDRELAVGDEVSIRILGPGKADEPK
jgi:hypothetical protein